MMTAVVDDTHDECWVPRAPEGVSKQGVEEDGAGQIGGWAGMC